MLLAKHGRKEGKPMYKIYWFLVKLLNNAYFKKNILPQLDWRASFAALTRLHSIVTAVSTIGLWGKITNH